ncbi:hypothetical protein WJX84_007884 [Apatococcus fuscideae]|uniref:Uncharacterized protein n=1 Tax=Apatococcus fuscideae TaxID=2026836 RepID=A0AAW1T170_9CHLO
MLTKILIAGMLLNDMSGASKTRASLETHSAATDDAACIAKDDSIAQDHGSMSTFVWCDTTSQQCSQLRVRLPDDLDIEDAVHGDEIACSELHSWALGHGNPSAYTVAAGTGHVLLLKWLAAQQSTLQATSVGSAEDQGLFETQSATFAAAIGGHLDVLQWQAAQGALTSELLGQAGVLAASQGHGPTGIWIAQHWPSLHAPDPQPMDTTGAAATAAAAAADISSKTSRPGTQRSWRAQYSAAAST